MSLLLFAMVCASDPVRPLDNIEHTQCHFGLGGCLPRHGCHLKNAACVPRVGHYWHVEEAAPSPPETASMMGRALDWLLSAPPLRWLPPVPPVSHMQTARGVLEVRPGWWFTRCVLHITCHANARSV